MSEGGGGGGSFLKGKNYSVFSYTITWLFYNNPVLLIKKINDIRQLLKKGIHAPSPLSLCHRGQIMNVLEIRIDENLSKRPLIRTRKILKPKERERERDSSYAV